ncbi:hypothetical protein [Microbispora hainanensis]|jgi:hypothetical protein|uniref:Uncharacterized protein n=1 Tax=Microbispora hainanensis TaxID=568844 RepID=A0ABZ1SHC4_9ACTN|nr:hypothetical protein [Microbispora hainanensis]
MTMWTPVVYGRTHRADRWWRALPAGISPNGWIADAVNAAVAGGRGLRWPEAVSEAAGETSRPEGSRLEGRYLLARRVNGGDGMNRANGVLMGVACYARALSQEMHTDEASRELYCFVGWWGTPQTPSDIPSFAALTENCERWAGDVYQTYFEQVWKEHPARVHTQESVPETAPWAQDDPVADGLVESPASAPEVTPPPLLGVGPAGFTSRKDEVLLYPASHAERLWDEGRRTKVPFTLVTGWDASAQALLRPVTHLCAADIHEPRTVPAPVIAQPPPPSPKPGGRKPEDKKPDADLLGQFLTEVGKVIRSLRSPAPEKNQKPGRSQGPAGHGSEGRPGRTGDLGTGKSRHVSSQGKEESSGQNFFSSQKKASPPVKAKFPEKTGDVNELDDL